MHAVDIFLTLFTRGRQRCSLWLPDYYSNLLLFQALHWSRWHRWSHRTTTWIPAEFWWRFARQNLPAWTHLTNGNRLLSIIACLPSSGPIKYMGMPAVASLYWATFILLLLANLNVYIQSKIWFPHYRIFWRILPKLVRMFMCIMSQWRQSWLLLISKSVR